MTLKQAVMNTNILLLIVTLLISSTVSAQFANAPAEDENNYVGKWQEYQRSYNKRGNDLVEFKDTMQLQFMPDSMVRIWYNDGKYFNKRYQFDRKMIRFGEQYTFRKHWLSEDELILKNEETYQFFKRVVNLRQGAIKKVIPGAERGEINVSPENLKGTWSTYKKEDKAFTGAKYYLKTLEIIEDDGRGNYKAKLTLASRTKIQGSEGNIQITGTKLNFTADEQSLTYDILKIENNEMLLSRDGAIIYLKEFSR
jgi:hypothetical protein